MILLAMVLSSLGKRSRGRSERVRRIVTPEGDPTVEAGETPSGGLGAELDRIEAAVDAGDTDLRRLGFWRVVGLIKRDDELIERYAEQVGRIDAQGVPGPGAVPGCPSGLGIALHARDRGRGRPGRLAVWIAGAEPIGPPRMRNSRPASGSARGRGAWAAGLHSLTHYARRPSRRDPVHRLLLRDPAAAAARSEDRLRDVPARRSRRRRAWMHASRRGRDEAGAVPRARLRAGRRPHPAGRSRSSWSSASSRSSTDVVVQHEGAATGRRCGGSSRSARARRARPDGARVSWGTHRGARTRPG